MNFTLCKNRCNYTKRNKQSRNPPLSVQPFQNRTIPRSAPPHLPYERSVGFASLQSPWAFNFGHPCPSLVKGEVLSPERIQATTGGIATPLSPRLRKPFQNRTIPRLALNLPPFSKGGGLTARHKLLLCCVLLAICPLFLYCKLFCRQDGWD